MANRKEDRLRIEDARLERIKAILHEKKNECHPSFEIGKY